MRTKILPHDLQKVWILHGLLALLVLLPAVACAAEAEPADEVPASVGKLLKKYCLECHAEKGQGDFDASAIHELPAPQRTEVLNKVQDQLFYRMMPPRSAEQPAAEERRVLSDWVRTELRRRKASKLDERLPYPSAGNYVDHESLFNGTIQEKPFTPARRWLVSPSIYYERVVDSLGLQGKQRETRLVGIVNPFTLPERSGVRDYDIVRLDGSHFVGLNSNAAWLASKVVGSLRVKAGEPLEQVCENPKDRWLPAHTQPDRTKTPTMPAFERIVTATTAPTDEELSAAISFQFERVLRRPPTEAEQRKYLQLTRSAVEIGGNLAGLRTLLETVWLESEFVYRLEFGAGDLDEFGRRLLSPREAAYAVAYSLGDREPDVELLQAAQQGRLQTKQDVEREVRRLLADEKAFRGQIDPILHEIYPSYAQNNLSSRPKIVRFFREFFGYPLANRVFKDVERSDGFYQNPGRGTYGTPGQLIREADLFVDAIVQADQSVFENLLTSDKFFAAPADDAAQKIRHLNEVYDEFQERDWYVNPNNKKPTPWLSPDELTFVRKRLNYNSGERDLSIAMTHVKHFREKGLTVHPRWSYPFGIHMLTPHVNSYSIKPPEWDYPAEQPFAVSNRKGILTHPAWLIAHSQNSATDPVVRGKWIREKLLAGVVPDVPITVDAVIPEDPHKTLRQRLDMVTHKEACWKCHQHMNPLGLTFEIFDDFGRYRTQESLEHPENIVAKAKTKYGADTYKTAPVDATGRLDGSGDPQLDGEVKDALELIDRLAKSDRVRQSILRHAFRFYLGRNEMLSDSQTLIEAERAYVNSGGSFREVIVALLTSDSFRYRKFDEPIHASLGAR